MQGHILSTSGDALSSEQTQPQPHPRPISTEGSPHPGALPYTFVVLICKWRKASPKTGIWWKALSFYLHLRMVGLLASYDLNFLHLHLNFRSLQWDFSLFWPFFSTKNFCILYQEFRWFHLDLLHYNILSVHTMISFETSRWIIPLRLKNHGKNNSLSIVNTKTLVVENMKQSTLPIAL